MGKICVDGTRCPCPPKPPLREGTAWYHTDKRRREKWETDHGGHTRAPAQRVADMATRDGSLAFRYASMVLHRPNMAALVRPETY